MRNAIILLMQMLACSVCFGQSNEKEQVASRPSVFPEIDNANLLCMQNCPVEISDFMGVKVLCANFAKAAYDQNCRILGTETAEYCNCNRTDCAKFAVACVSDGSVCHVRMVGQGIQPLACECGGRTCEQAAIESSLSTCVIRHDVNTRLCSLDSYGTLADGNALYTTCEAQNSCASQQIQTAVSNKPAMTVPKPSEPK